MHEEFGPTTVTVISRKAETIAYHKYSAVDGVCLHRNLRHRVSTVQPMQQVAANKAVRLKAQTNHRIESTNISPPPGRRRLRCVRGDAEACRKRLPAGEGRRDAADPDQGGTTGVWCAALRCGAPRTHTYSHSTRETRGRRAVSACSLVGAKLPYMLLRVVISFHFGSL